MNEQSSFAGSGPKVVVCANTSWYLFNFRRRLIEALTAAGYEVWSVAPHDDYTERLRGCVAGHHDLDFSSSTMNPVAELHLLLRLFRLVRRLAPQALLSFTPKPNIYGSLAARLAGVAVINNVAGLGSGFVGHAPVLEHIIKLMYRLSVGGSDRVFFQNRDDLDLLVEEGIADRGRAVLISGSGVDLERFVFRPLRRHGGEPFRFLFVARMLKSKGVEEFLDAAERLDARFPGAASFTLCGSLHEEHAEGVPAATLQRYAGHPSIQYAGHVDDIVPFLVKSHCVVLPSYYREGVPRSLLEAMATGRPLITTAMPGCRETVNGGNGWTIAPRNVDQLFQVMKSACELPEARLAAMGAESRRYAEARFDERVVISCYLEQLDAVLRDRGVVTVTRGKDNLALH